MKYINNTPLSRICHVIVFTALNRGNQCFERVVLHSQDDCPLGTAYVNNQSDMGYQLWKNLLQHSVPVMMARKLAPSPGLDQKVNVQCTDPNQGSGILWHFYSFSPLTWNLSREIHASWKTEMFRDSASAEPQQCDLLSQSVRIH